MSEMNNQQTHQASEPSAPSESEWGPTMDRQAHIQGYKGFLRVIIISGVVVALVMIFMALFLT